MPNFRATHKQTGEIAEYNQSLPLPEHLTATKASVDVEAFVMLVTLATPDAGGYAIDLDDPRMVALYQLEQAGVLGAGRAQEILNG